MRSRMRAPLTPEIEEWRKRSPIKRWLDSKPDRAKQRRKEMREDLKVERVMLYYWINGVALPKTDKFVRICAMIQCSQKTYLEWFNAYPEPETDECVERATPASV